MHELRHARAHDFDILTTVYFEPVNAPGGILSSLLNTIVTKNETPYHKVSWVHENFGTCSGTIG